MGLIIKDKIAQLKKGYPTVSDKYNVQGGVYVGDGDALHFGDLLAYSGTTGHYVKLAAGDGVADLAGICLATNVKLANKYPGDSNAKVETLKGEAFNLLVRGFIAVAISSAALVTAKAMPETTDEEKAAKKAAIKAANEAIVTLVTTSEGAPVYLDANGSFSTDTAGTVVPGVYFMGVAEIIDGEALAEINYKM